MRAAFIGVLAAIVVITAHSALVDATAGDTWTQVPRAACAQFAADDAATEGC